MNNYILIWDCSQYDFYPTLERFPSESEMDKRVDELTKSHGVKFSILLAGFLSAEYDYVPVEKVIKYERKRK